MKYFYLLLLVTIPFIVKSQSVGIGITTPDPSAILHLESNSKGFLLPSMGTIQREAIVSPAFGLLVYDFNTKSIWMNSTAGWTELVTDGSNYWTKIGSDIFHSVGNVGIGLNSTVNRLHVHNALTSSNYFRITNSVSGSLASDGLLLGAIGSNASLMNLESGGLVIGTNNDSALYLTNVGNSPRLGIGVPNPSTALDVTHTSSSGNTARFNSNNGFPMYVSIFENNLYRGYWGSYSGNAEDVDLGTGTTNSTGKLHLTIQADPKLTINTFGTVGIGTANPLSNTRLHVRGDSLHTGYFTSTNTNIGASILKTELLSGVTDYFATGIEVDQYVTPGRGLGLKVTSGYIGAEILSVDANFAVQNYGLISTATSDADNWGVYSVANGSGITGTRIGVYSSASGGATRWAFYGVGNAFLTGGTWQTSDEKFKKNILPIQGAAAKLLLLNPSQYQFDRNQYSYLNLPEESQLGFLASNMQEVFPELVKRVSTYKERPVPGEANEKVEFNAVNYTGLIPVLTQAVNEHTKEISELKALLEQYRVLVQEQQKLLNELKNK